MSKGANLDDNAGEYEELDQATLTRLKEKVKKASEYFKKNPQKSFDDLMNFEGIYSTSDEFGKYFKMYLGIEKKVVDDPSSLTEDEVGFYQQVWPIFDPIDNLVKEREEFLEFQKRYPGSQKATTSNFVEENDFNFEELINLSDRATKDSQSPLIIFDSVIADVKNKTIQSLNPDDDKISDEFFKTIDPTQINEITFPGRMEEVILNSSVAIELSLEGHHKDFENSEAKDACESYLTALALNEIEQKLLFNEKRAKNEVNERAEVAAVSSIGFTIDDQNDQTSKNQTSQHHLDFDIHNLSYDISFLPSDDSETYKPLEIVSYIGLTRNHQKT